MKIIHKCNDYAIEGNGSSLFLLTNQRGDYLALGKPDFSHFCGWLHYLPEKNTLYKTIENLTLEYSPTILINHLDYIKRGTQGAKEIFYLAGELLVYEVSNYQGYIQCYLDFREIYDFDDKGRIYEIYKDKEYVIVNYKKFADNSLTSLQHSRSMAIYGVSEYEHSGQWQKKEYSYDKQRGSKYIFYVYQGLRIKITDNRRLIFAVASTPAEAIARIKNYSQPTFNKPNSPETDLELIYQIAANALNALVINAGTKDETQSGIWAGLPWFFQCWSRDELISLKAILILRKYELVKRILMKYLKQIDATGRIPNIMGVPSTNADGAGWLFKRWHDFVAWLTQKKMLNLWLSKKELLYIKVQLNASIKRLWQHYAKGNLLWNNSKETWMDTEFGDNGRAGARIEIQALYLAQLRFANYLNLLLNHHPEYKTEERQFARQVREHLFKDGILYDGITEAGIDATVRPNIFIAYYVYPELLKPSEWKTAFNYALKKLWLDWGGLASIDRESPLFCESYSGQDDRSYHRGDSWFFLNNLAALCMYKLDKLEFKNYILKILTASVNDLLFGGAVGHHSELSSARELSPAGCFAQAWSAAMLIELLAELKRDDEFRHFNLSTLYKSSY